MIGYCFNIIGQAVWVFVRASQDPIIDERSFSRWGSIVLIIISAIILIVIFVLLGFHVYISCCENLTTLEYIYKDDSDKGEKRNGVNNGNSNGKKPIMLSQKELKTNERF